MKLNKRLTSSVLAVAIVASLGGCQSNKKDCNSEVDANVLDTQTIEEDNLNVELVGQKNIDVLAFLNENYYDDTIDYEAIISNYSSDYELKMSNIEMYYKAIYMRLYNSGISMDKYLSEFNSMLVLGVVPMCIPDDIWNANFSSLISTLQEEESLYEVYLDFAIMVHEITCDLEHKENEYYAYSCTNLDEQFALMRNK